MMRFLILLLVFSSVGAAIPYLLYYDEPRKARRAAVGAFLFVFVMTIFFRLME